MKNTHEHWSLLADLLLASTPSKTLEDLDLSIITRKSWVVDCHTQTTLNPHLLISMTALALYFANRSKASFKKSHAIQLALGKLPPEVIYKIVQLSKAEETEEMEAMLTELANQKSSQAGKKAVSARHSKENSAHQKAILAKKKLLEVWASGKFSTRYQCADQEHEGLGISFNTAIKALRNSPAPVNWVAKTTRKVG